MFLVEFFLKNVFSTLKYLIYLVKLRIIYRSMAINLKKIRSVHCIGIGGIGLSAVARMLYLQGKKVTGSDRDKSKVTDGLEKIGIPVSISNVAANIPRDCDLVLYTNALPADNSELIEARKRNIPILSYPEILGLLLKDKFIIAISGTHGKTTTTAMVGEILVDAGLKPTVIVGGFIKNPQSGQETNFISGESEYAVVEADEYKEAFLQLSPRILVITNIDEDHLDHYRDLSHIQETFGQFVLKIPDDGFLITDVNNPHLRAVLEYVTGTVIDYASVKPSWKLKVPGDHNIANAKAAAAVAGLLRVNGKTIKKSLESFVGVGRRFEYKGKTALGALVYDDYAHNPQKVEATISGARQMFPDKRLTVVFQPHLYSRTKFFIAKFARALSKADCVIVTDIYAAREKEDPTISGEILARAVEKQNKNTLFISDFTAIEKRLETGSSEKDVVITMGAGDIGKVSDKIIGR